MPVPNSAKYPVELDDDTTLFSLWDRKSFTLAGGIGDTSLAIVVNESCAGLTGNFYLAFNTGEMIYVTSVVTGTRTMTIVRGAGGTSPTTHAQGEGLKMIVTAQIFEQFKKVFVAIENELGVLAKGAFNSVAARLADAESRLTNHNHSGGANGPRIDADTVDTYHATATPAAGKVVVSDAGGKVDGWVSNSATGTPGKVALATSAEVTTGSDAAKAITPSALAHSNPGRRVVEIVVLDNLTAPTVKNGLGDFNYVIPAELNGMNLVSAHVACPGAVSSSGTPTFRIYNVRKAAVMLSTYITLDANENTSFTASIPPIIDVSNDDVLTGDLLRFDCTVVGTGTKGCVFILSFQVP